jgi:uncharacterized protein YkwD
VFRLDRRRGGGISSKTRLAAVVVGCIVALAALGWLGTPAAQALEGVSYSEEELAFVRLLNEYRADNGLGALFISDTISQSCDRHNSDMAKYGFFDHYTVESDWFAKGSTPPERMILCGYDYKTVMGENLAGGCSTAAQALEGWQNSPTHRAIMLRDDLKVMGVSLVYVSGSEWGYYWTTEFGGYFDSTADITTSTSTSLNSPTAVTGARLADRDLWKRLLFDIRI